jgi:hypothetical protein
LRRIAQNLRQNCALVSHVVSHLAFLRWYSSPRSYLSAVTPAPSTWLHRTSPTSTTSHEPPASSVRMPPSTAGVTIATRRSREPSASSAAPIASAPAG